ncbi:OmpA family protein [Agitococcus lubricus]|uniref:OmpA family protein n=1 Tax=Agitococcus lubricus TaxID=1077255 RepID=A0A2T5J3H0_9GAMM|nr:OmpA family protein [Agitococcus lubricus]PTQ91155.1 OmpA family protein [Agitococcus lubricus]
MLAHKMKVSLLALAVSVCRIAHAEDMTVVAASPAPTVLDSQQQQRISDQVIGRDLQAMKGLQDRIAKLNNNGVGAENYYLVKAQAWLDFAMHEYYENDRSLVIEHALEQSAGLIAEMEAANNNITLDTPIIPESQRLREDLWIIAAQLKQHQGFSCAAAPLAEMEVRLVWAGHENKEMGWRHAREHFAAAERLAKQAKKLADNCFCPPEAEKPCPLTQPPVEQPPVIAVTPSDKPFAQKVIVPDAGPTPLDLVNVPRNVHFGLDKSNINEKGTIILDRVAEILKAYPRMTIVLVGHTDSRASKAYNLALSERRAKSVLKYLNEKGIAKERMTYQAVGFDNLKTAEDELMGHALSRRVEIAYIGENIQSYDQTGDIVVEEARKKAEAKAAARAMKKSKAATSSKAKSSKKGKKAK